LGETHVWQNCFHRQDKHKPQSQLSFSGCWNALLYFPGAVQWQGIQPEERHLGAGLHALRVDDVEKGFRSCREFFFAGGSGNWKIMWSNSCISCSTIFIGTKCSQYPL